MLIKGLALIAFSLLSLKSIAQDNLTIGDPAPEMKYSKWLKGKPVKSFNRDRMYVVEFWATWCGPCVQAMPHLSELSKKYKDKATFIGVNIWEKTGEQPYESSLPSVTKFVKSMGDKMAYSVVADNNDQHMANQWMVRAGQNGIPATFLIREGKVIWIGHPIKLDSIINLVENGSYDMAAVKKSFEETRARSEKRTADMRRLMDPVAAAMKAKEYGKAFELIDKAIAEMPQLKFSLISQKLMALLDQGKEKEAFQLVEETKKDFRSLGLSFASSIIEKTGLSKEAYMKAAEEFGQAASMPGIVLPMVYHMQAKAYNLAGDFENAVRVEEKAIEAGQAGLKEGKWSGILHDYTIEEYKDSLAKYKSAKKS